MKINVFTNNRLELQGRISKINEYSAGKAANVTLAIDNGKDKDGNDRPTSFIQTKSFTPSCYNELKVGMKVRIHGHIAPGSYQKGTETIYTQDIVADFIEFLESKAAVDAREAAKASAS